MSIEMTERQRFAYEHPCKTEADLFGFGYQVDAPRGGHILTSHLCVRLYQKPIGWHCSISFWDIDFKLLPVARWTANMLNQAVAEAIALLDGVGEGAGGGFRTEEFCLHFMRRLTGDELLAFGRGIEILPPPPPLPAASFQVVNVTQ